MESASKALLIAGSVLIGILVVSLGVYLFVTFGQNAREVEQRNAEQQLAQFNTTYTVYQGRNDLTIYDIITVVNQVKENNGKYVDITDNRRITVNVTGSGLTDGTNLQNKPNSVLDGWLKDDIAFIESDPNQELPHYTCSGINMLNGRVSVINFVKN